MGLTNIKLGKYVELYSEKCNVPNLSNDEVSGVNKDKEFFEPSNQVGSDTSKYKIVPPNYFAYNPNTARMGDKIPIALNKSDCDVLVSSIYPVFKIDETQLLAEYALLWFKRPEFDRYARYNSWGSARETFNWEDMQRVKIPLPPIEVQRSIVALYNCAEEARAIAKEAREQLKILAPAMVQRAANTPREV